MRKSTILFYSPFNQRSRDTESVMIAFQQQGHRVISLSQALGAQIHDFLKQYNIETYSFSPLQAVGWIRHCKHIFFLIRFCRMNKVDIVYSHLESANFIASTAQFFISAKVYICRHHSDQYRLLGHDKVLSYRLTYSLAKNIVVVSEATKKYLIAQEGIPEHKITVINLAYDFSLYHKVDSETVEKIRNEIDAKIILITIGNLNSLKRPDVSLQLLNALIRKGYDAKLVLLGRGEFLPSLMAQMQNLELAGKVFFPGYVENVLDYMQAASFVIHPSVSESSCVVLKEAGLVSKPVIVCKGVGDFDDFLIHGKNGFLVNRDAFAEEASEIIAQNYQNKELLQSIGKNLNQSVFDLFSIQHVIGKYNSLNAIK